MPHSLRTIKTQLHTWAKDAGFQQVGITDCNLADYKGYFEQWLASDHHGTMEYMARNIDKRLNPEKLVEGTLRVISFRMDYLPEHEKAKMPEILASSNNAYISRYALGRDYHKLLRKKLAAIAKQLEQATEKLLDQRPFVDSAPVLERAFAEKAGLGWIGKNTMLINKQAGSYFFLGEILTSLPLEIDDTPSPLHCGSCTACLISCPTDAFKGPHQLDAKKCISYLTIEHKGPIPVELRKKMGNRIYGCDDCQIVCPWNKFSEPSQEIDFSPRQQLDQAKLLDLLKWNEATFLKKTEGSPIRRIGYAQWVRNLAVGLGNSEPSTLTMNKLQEKLSDPALNAITKEHLEWAIKKHLERL